MRTYGRPYFFSDPSLRSQVSNAGASFAALSGVARVQVTMRTFADGAAILGGKSRTVAINSGLPPDACAVVTKFCRRVPSVKYTAKLGGSKGIAVDLISRRIL